jgi:hypothetical protein
MATLTREEKDVFGWLDKWWYDIEAWMEDPVPLTGSTWRAAVFQAGVIPDELHGLDLSPLKDLLFAMVAYGDPSPVNGPRLTRDELWALNSKAWDVSRHIPRVIYERNERVKNTELVGPFDPQWLRLLVGVEDPRTLRKRLDGRQREETQRRWYVPSDFLEGFGEWEAVLREKSSELGEKQRAALLSFLATLH